MTTLLWFPQNYKIKYTASGLRGYFIFLLPSFLFFSFQTWKTSRFTEEALSQSVKVKEWFCCAAPRHILEVKQICSYCNSCSPSGQENRRWVRSETTIKTECERMVREFVIFSDRYLQFEALGVWLVWYWFRSRCFNDTFDSLTDTFHVISLGSVMGAAALSAASACIRTLFLHQLIKTIVQPSLFIIVCSQADVKQCLG